MKKVIILLAVLLTAALGALLVRQRGSPVPERVSVYLVQESRIVTLSYRDYLAGCLFANVSSTCGEEGLKAIACALNSKALYILENPQRSLYSGADFSDDAELCLPYITPEAASAEFGERYPDYHEKIYKAVDFGMNYALTYNDKIIPAQMCRFSSGTTDSGGEEFPYLVSAEVPADKNIEDALSTRAVSADMVMRALSNKLGITALPDDRSKWFTDAVYLPSGTLKEISFGGKKLSGKQLKEIFGLRSTAITIEYAEQRFVFTVKGIGDNLGMSINAASVMARQGHTYDEILSAFYSGAELISI